MLMETYWRAEDGGNLPVLLWRTGPGYRMISSAVAGGGIGPRAWVLNAQVSSGYARRDPEAHVAELAAGLGLAGPGVGLLTAAQVTSVVTGEDNGVCVAATVGLHVPVWAAAADDPGVSACVPGTINIVVSVPVPLSDAALVNAVVTATEAKTQALLEAGFACTGTASDAVCVAVPQAGEPEPFAGPRSRWGARIARAVHGAVRDGAVRAAHGRDGMG